MKDKHPDAFIPLYFSVLPDSRNSKSPQSSEKSPKQWFFLKKSPTQFLLKKWKFKILNLSHKKYFATLSSKFVPKSSLFLKKIPIFKNNL
jgi:hypothetical protein